MTEYVELIKTLATLVVVVVVVLKAKSFEAHGNSHSFDVRFRSK